MPTEVFHKRIFNPRSCESENVLISIDISLPFFTYGLYQEGEFAFRQIIDCLAVPAQLASVKGHLKIRDGLPLIIEDEHRRVTGNLLTFKAESARIAYSKIVEFEPYHQYDWKEISLPESQFRVNILIAKEARNGSDPERSDSWSGKDDLVFTHGLDCVGELIQNKGVTKFPNAPELCDEEWKRFFLLQSSYLLLWSVIERYTALAYGPEIDPNKRLEKLDDDVMFGNAVKKTIKHDRNLILYDIRNPARPIRLKPDRPDMARKYFYQIRNNLSHRGRGAWRDCEIVRQSLLELYEVMCLVLAANGITTDSRISFQAELEKD